MKDVQVRAAGAVLWRDRGGLEVAIVHRPRYGDWSFPKGKCEKGESDEECAKREVAEETGLTGELGPELVTVYYDDRHGRSKQVRFWAMEPSGASSGWDDEVDVLCWLPVETAVSVLSYERDVTVLQAFCRSIDPYRQA